MGKTAFRDNDVTTPAAPISAAAIKSPVNAKLNVPAANDPVQYDADTDVSPYVKQGDIRIRANQIVNKFETTESQLEEERQSNFGYTQNEISRLVSALYMSIYEPEPFIVHASYTPSPTVNMVPPGYSAGRSFGGNSGPKYTEIMGEDGKLAYYDTLGSCSLTKPTLGATTPLPNAALAASLNYNAKPQTPEEANLKRIVSDIDSRYTEYQSLDSMVASAANEATFKSFSPSNIKADSPSKPFATAAAAVDAPATQGKSIMFTAQAPAPWAKPAANAPAYEPSI